MLQTDLHSFRNQGMATATPMVRFLVAIIACTLIAASMAMSAHMCAAGSVRRCTRGADGGKYLAGALLETIRHDRGKQNLHLSSLRSSLTVSLLMRVLALEPEQLHALRGGADSLGASPRDAVRDHVFVSGLPPYANEEWVSVLLGRNSVKKDEETGKRKVRPFPT